jgi:hypothetical protein
MALVDRGANGSMAGGDVFVLEYLDRNVDVAGFDRHKVNDIPLVTALGWVMTTTGPVILVLHQYAYLGHGKTIHSSGQLEWYGCDVDERSRKIKGGKQRILTPDGYEIPLSICHGLAYMDMRPPTEEERKELPYVIMTSDEDWDPSVLDNEQDAVPDPSVTPVLPVNPNPRFTPTGNLIVQHLETTSPQKIRKKRTLLLWFQEMTTQTVTLKMDMSQKMLINGKTYLLIHPWYHLLLLKAIWKLLWLATLTMDNHC